MNHGQPYDSERRLLVLRTPKLCWWHEAVVATPIEHGLPGPLDREWSEICGFTIGVAPDEDGADGGADTFVHRIFFLDADPEIHANPSITRDVPSARMIVGTHARQPAPHPHGRGFKGTVDIATEAARRLSIEAYWLAMQAVATDAKPISMMERVLAEETDLVAIVPSYRQLPWLMETVIQAYPWKRDSWGDRIIVAHSVGGSHCRLWWLPKASSVDRDPPRHSIDPKSIRVGRPTNKAKRRSWFGGCPRAVRLELD